MLRGSLSQYRTILAGALRSDPDLQKANFHMTEQRIVLGDKSAIPSSS